MAYLKEGNVWLWVEGGSNQALTTAGGAAGGWLSDDGLVAAYLRQVDDFRSELWAINSDGSNDRRLVSVDDYLKENQSSWELGVGSLLGESLIIDQPTGLPPAFDFDL